MYVSTVLSQQMAFRFTNLTIDHGLSQSSIYSITQDKKGFIWFGTQDGLNRYDGYKFTVYNNDPNDDNTISNKYIHSICEDQNGILWIGTWGGGLNKFNTSTKKITRYKNNNSDNSLSNDFVRTIYEDKNYNLWIGTADGTLHLMNKENSTFTRFKTPDINNGENEITSIFEDKNNVLWVANKSGLHVFDRKTKKITISYNYDANDDKTISSNKLNTIYEDSFGTLWFGTDNGLNKFNKKTKTFTRFQNDINDPKSIMHNNVSVIFEDKNQNLWIGMLGGGLAKYQEKTNTFIKFIHEPSNLNSLMSNQVQSAFVDKFGILWVGIYSKGITKLNFNPKKFTLFRETSNNNSLNNNSIFSIYEDNNDNIWIGTYGGGVNIYNTESKKFTYLKNILGNSNSLSNNFIRDIFKDSKGNFWFSTWGGGLDLYNPKTKKFKHFVHKPNKNSISSNKIYKVIEDRFGTIWIATYNGGLCKYEPNTNKFSYIKHNVNDSTSLSHNDVFSIFEDFDGTLWICTRNGLNHYNQLSKKITQYKTDGTKNTPSTLEIYSINKTSHNVYWLGTGNGLNRFDSKTKKFAYFTQKDGLPNNVIYDLLIDNGGNLWLSTNNGLSRFNPKTYEVKNFNKKDGLQSNEFNLNACFRNKYGKLYFGGINGFNVFSPIEIKDNQYEPTVVITDFKIFNKSIPVGKMINDRIILEKNISETKKIILSHNDYVFSFDFAALHYVSPENNKFKYKLEGFEKEWNYTPADRRFVTYTNLNPRTYVFRVKATNNDGIWSKDEARITIIVEPPFWKTWWFRISAIIFAISVILMLVKLRMKRIKIQNEILEKLVKVRTAEVVKQRNDISLKNTKLKKQKEEILSQSELLSYTNKELEKLSIVASETDNAVLIMNSQGTIEWVNEGYKRLYGYNLDETKARGESIIDISSNIKIKEAINYCIINKKSHIYQAQSVTKSGNKIWVQTTLTPIINNNKIVKLIAIDSNITKLKSAEREILNQSEELLVQKHELTIRKNKIEIQNENIRASIKYAQTIQKAILPIQNTMNQYLETEIIFKPKDIVSGDFYWFSIVNENNKKSAFIAVVDCTGHGVPGAFMSMIGSRLLNEIVNEKRILEPASILENLNIGVSNTLKQEQTDNNDGMDVCICKIENIESNKNRVTFSGARRPLYYYKQGDDSISIIKGDKKSIGGIRARRSNVQHTNNELILSNGDTLYLSSDGIIDQNTTDRKRFGSVRFLNVLNNNVDKSIPLQKHNMLESLYEFQNNELQRDDITLVIIKLVDKLF